MKELMQLVDKDLVNSKPKPDLKKLLARALELADEETVCAGLSAIIKRKEADLLKKEYWQNINKMEEVELMTTEETRNWFLARYHQIEQKIFVEDEYSYPVLNAICLYFSNNKEFEEINESYNLNKGLLIYGNVGCGKSSILKIFQQNQKSGFRFVSCRNIAKEFSKSGDEAIEKYCRMGLNLNRSMHYGQTHVGWFFDDLAFENNAKHFGRDANIMVDVLQQIYDKPEMKGKVHTSTNATATELEELYGNRMKSRMRQMFNVIAYDENAPDRR